MQQYLDLYLNRLKAVKSENTYKTYVNSLKYFFKNNQTLDPGYIYKKIIEMRRKNLSNNTIRTRLNALSDFVNFVQRREKLSSYEELIEACRSVKQEEKIIETLTTEQIKQAIESTPNFMHKTIIKVLSCSALRISELISLTVDDYKDGKLYVRIRGQKTTKSKTERYVVLSRCACEMLDVYIKTSGVTNKLFPVNANTIQAMMYRLSKKLGFRIHPHSLRHYALTKMLHGGVDINTCKDIAGHKSIQTTTRYLHSNSDTIAKAAEVFEW